VGAGAKQLPERLCNTQPKNVLARGIAVKKKLFPGPFSSHSSKDRAALSLPPFPKRPPPPRQPPQAKPPYPPSPCCDAPACLVTNTLARCRAKLLSLCSSTDLWALTAGLCRLYPGTGSSDLIQLCAAATSLHTSHTNRQAACMPHQILKRRLLVGSAPTHLFPALADRHFSVSSPGQVCGLSLRLGIHQGGGGRGCGRGRGADWKGWERDPAYAGRCWLSRGVGRAGE